jgi:quercetin dioxygenase-like cupin family protein
MVISERQTTGPASAIPADDPSRTLSLINPDDPALRHVAVVGDTYTILLSGAETAGQYSLIDMNIPHCGGPGPHRHDFEEMFHILDGEVEFTFRGEKHVVKAGMTVNIPANAPHFFTNIEGRRARMLCMCAPAGQEEFFMGIGTPVESRTAPVPKQSKDEQTEFLKKAKTLAPKYRTEILNP